MDAARSTALALLVLVVAIAGCTALTDSSETDDPASTATTTPLPVDTPTPTTTPGVSPTRPPERFTTGPSNLGEHEQPHGIRLRNARNETTIAVTLHITRADGETSFEDTYRLAPQEDHYGILDYKANYTVTVTVGDHTATEHISKAMFDCNDSTTTFTSDEDRLTVRTLSTMVGCPTESPA